MILSEDRGAIVALLEEGISRGVSAKAIADLFGLATRTLRRWGLMIRAQGFSRDQRRVHPIFAMSTSTHHKGVFAGEGFDHLRDITHGTWIHREMQSQLQEITTHHPQPK